MDRSRSCKRGPALTRRSREEANILEVDLEYLEELHDPHNAYPPTMERVKVDVTWMSNYQLVLLKEM